MQECRMKNAVWYLLFAICYLLLANCSFDYGGQGGADRDTPDVVMDNVEYVRFRSMNPQARMLAERVERYEERGIMELYSFSFEQYGTGGEEVNAFGRAGKAAFEIDTGNIRMDNGVRLEVESEDIIIETRWLQWIDRARTLSSGEKEEVHIFQEKGTSFTGTGFRADARNRTWEFSSGVSGTYVYDDDEEEEEEIEEEVVFEIEDIMDEGIDENEYNTIEYDIIENYDDEARDYEF
jgi:LPS export ABC transporter protein LptC